VGRKEVEGKETINKERGENGKRQGSAAFEKGSLRYAQDTVTLGVVRRKEALRPQTAANPDKGSVNPLALPYLDLAFLS
jgi:hypothetical protein